MDLIYTTKKHEDVGVLQDYTFDLAFGSDENDFELKLATENHCCEAGSLVYIEGTEYGGIIDGLKVVTKDEELTYKGRTWHGILESKVIEPDSGADYLVLSGEANEVLRTLIDRIGLSDLFMVADKASGLTISNYSVPRYVKAYSGIMKMLADVGGKLQFSVNRLGMVSMWAVPAVDYTQDEQFDSDQIEMEIDTTYSAVNHLICLGKGDLKDRQVLHLYVNKNGSISKTKAYTGLDEVTEVYDYSSVESLAELEKGGREKLAEYAIPNSVKMNFPAEKTIYDVGDIVGAKDNVTNISAAEKITKKIVQISGGEVNIEYKVGETL